jgi:hypothetical protein
MQLMTKVDCEKSLHAYRFLLDSYAQENNTLVSCFMRMNATSMATSNGSAGKRNQGKAST